MKYKIPIWNGIQDQPGVSAEWLEIGHSDFNGIYNQTTKRIIDYHNNYKHMTPLKGSDYINELRKGKIDWILNHGLYQRSKIHLLSAYISHSRSKITTFFSGTTTCPPARTSTSRRNNYM